MRYKITKACKRPPSRAAVIWRKKRCRTERDGTILPCSAGEYLPREKETAHSPADVAELFGFGGFYDPYSEQDGVGTASKDARRRKTARFRAFVWRVRMLAERQKETIVSKIRLARERRAARRKSSASLPMLCGALCAILCVFALSGGVVFYRLLLQDRILRFERVTTPELVGRNYEELALDSELFELKLNYEYDADAPKGTVIEQSPAAGVIRRVYHGGEPCRVTLTVSLGERSFVMKDYTRVAKRDALLELKNEAIKFKISEKYSDTVPAGCVISTAPTVGESFCADEVVTLLVSLGKEKKYAAVPDLLGLTEVRAGEVLRALGFEVGEIRYVASQSPCGTVISQGISAYSLSALGSRIDINISAGVGFSEKKVPDLYGLTIEEARERLAEVGLVCGKIYTVQSGASVATVVSQSIAAGTPITSGVVSVDVYVSS